MRWALSIVVEMAAVVVVGVGVLVGDSVGGGGR